eukprot:SAG11_NODE_1438_length_4908_cov_22.894157_1_plen_208_part_10
MAERARDYSLVYDVVALAPSFGRTRGVLRGAAGYRLVWPAVAEGVATLQQGEDLACAWHELDKFRWGVWGSARRCRASLRGVPCGRKGGGGRRFLGVEPDLRAEYMVLRLPASKRADLRRSCLRLLSSDSLLSPRSIARTLGKLVAARDAVQHELLHCRYLQHLQTSALQLSRSQRDVPSIRLSPAAALDLRWWVETTQNPTACEMKL